MEEITHIVMHTLEHSIEDTLYLIPFLFVTYLAMEWLEHKTGGRTQEAVQRAGAAGPVLGSLLGVIPQCGFSAAAATLYAGRVITLGTVFAVFLSTSDEMLPIFLAEQVPIGTVVKVMGAKVIIGMVMGFIVDAALRLIRRDRQNLRIHELCARDKCHCGGDCATCEENPALVYEHHDDCGSCCTHEHHEHDHGHDHDHGWKGIAKSALVHTAQVTLFIFVITLVLNGVLETVGGRSPRSSAPTRCSRCSPPALVGPRSQLRGERGHSAALRRGRSRRGGDAVRLARLGGHRPFWFSSARTVTRRRTLR